MSVRYHVVAGNIRSKNDGDTHFISAEKLALLYGLKPSEWKECPGRMCQEELEHLSTDDSGDYQLL